MVNKKKQLREELRADKVERLRLLKEYRDPSTSESRLRELGITLGFIKLKSILGSSLPLRVCKHCGYKAKDTSELFDFHGHSLTCKKCYKLLRATPKVNIVGPFSFLKDKPQTCSKCGGTHSFSSKKHGVCDVCLGKAQVILGEVTRRGVQQTKGIPLSINGTPYQSIGAASKALGISYASLRAYALGLTPTPPELIIAITIP